MNKRLKWLDIAKGIGILLVVLGHSQPYLDERMGETVRKLRPEPAFTQAIRPKS